MSNGGKHGFKNAVSISSVFQIDSADSYNMSPNLLLNREGKGLGQGNSISDIYNAHYYGHSSASARRSGASGGVRLSHALRHFAVIIQIRFFCIFFPLAGENTFTFQFL